MIRIAAQMACLIEFLPLVMKQRGCSRAFLVDGSCGSEISRHSKRAAGAALAICAVA
jgi:hypothetical protein